MSHVWAYIVASGFICVTVHVCVCVCVCKKDQNTGIEIHSKKTEGFSLQFILKQNPISNYFTTQLKVQEKSRGKLKIT